MRQAVNENARLARAVNHTIYTSSPSHGNLLDQCIRSCGDLLGSIYEVVFALSGSYLNSSSALPCKDYNNGIANLIFRQITNVIISRYVCLTIQACLVSWAVSTHAIRDHADPLIKTPQLRFGNELEE